MIWRNLGIVAVLFVGLGAFVYFYEIEGGKKARSEAAEEAKKLFQFEEGGGEFHLPGPRRWFH